MGSRFVLIFNLGPGWSTVLGPDYLNIFEPESASMAFKSELGFGQTHKNLKVDFKGNPIS